MPLLSVIPVSAGSTSHPQLHQWSALPAIKITPNVSSAPIPHNVHPAPSDTLYPFAIFVQLNTLELNALSVRLDTSRMAATATRVALPSLPTAAPATSVQFVPIAILAMSFRQTVAHVKLDSTTQPQMLTILSTAPHAPRWAYAAQNAPIHSTAQPAPSVSLAQHAKLVLMDIREMIVQFATQEQVTTLLEVEYAQPVRSPTILTA
jgi:hypothetical protein